MEYNEEGTGGIGEGGRDSHDMNDKTTILKSRPSLVVKNCENAGWAGSRGQGSASELIKICQIYTGKRTGRPIQQGG